MKLILFSLMILSIQVQATTFEELSGRCTSKDLAVFNDITVLTCQRFANSILKPMTREQALKIKTIEKTVREYLIKHKLDGDLSVKMGVKIVSQAEVWFIPEIALFYEQATTLEVINKLIKNHPSTKGIILGHDDFMVTGVYQGYLTQPEAEMETFMSSQDWIELSGQARLEFAQSMLALTGALQTQQNITSWKDLLHKNLPTNHYLDWDVVSRNNNKSYRLSTYFDYQWYSKKAPENNTYTTLLIEEFESELLPQNN